MIGLSGFTTNVLVRLGEMTNRSFILPLLIYYPTSRCNSRCMSCDWWRSTGEDDLTLGEIASVAQALPSLGTRAVAFSGGEPLVRADVFEVAALFQEQGVKLQILTSGLLLQRHARDVAKHFSRVTISLDGSRAASYEAIRGVDGLSTIETGVATLKALAPQVPITARATLHAANFRELPCLVEKAKAMGLDGISFLAADVSSTAFGRTAPPRGARLLLNGDEVAAFEALIEQTERDHAEDFASGFIAESTERLRRLPHYYAAMRRDRPFPPAACNAPWVSAVIEANGGVRPCFFHRPVGNVRQRPLIEIIRNDLPVFRRTLDVSSNALCQRCVCSIKAGWGSGLWQ